MHIRNMRVNILYFLCNAVGDRKEAGTALASDVMDEFSDIPEDVVYSMIDAMVADELIQRNLPNSLLTITAKGINLLQTSVAHSIQGFDCLPAEHR